jgi:hypothetical protein
MLIFGAVACSEAYLAQCIVEAGSLCEPCKLYM